MENLDGILNRTSLLCESSELFYNRSFTEKIKFDANELQSFTGKQSEGIALRLRKNGRVGFCTSTKIDEHIIDKAIEGSEFGDVSEYDFACENFKFSEDYREKKIDTLNFDELIIKGEDLIKKIREFDKRINVKLIFARCNDEVAIMTSNGFKGRYEKSYYDLAVNTEFTRENDIFEMWKGLSGSSSIGQEDTLLKEILFDLSNSNVVKIDSGKYPVLFAPEAVEELLAGFIFGIGGNRIYRKTSPLYSKLNEEIFDTRITLYDDPSISGVTNSIPFDDEGIEAKRKIIVEKGILKSFLVDLKNSRKLNMAPTGNSLRKNWFGSRSYEFYPAINHTTVDLEPGKSAVEDLIKGIDKGLLVKSAPDLSMGNIQNGDFAGTVCNGYKIEKGRITGRVKNTVISGNLYRLLKEQIVDMSSDLFLSLSGTSRVPFILFNNVVVSS